MVADDVFRDQPVLPGARVRLEPLASRHFDGLWPMFGEPEGSRLTGTHLTFTEAQIRGWLATRRDHHDRADWAIVRVADGPVLGEAVINDLDAPNAAANFRIALVGPARRDLDGDPRDRPAAYRRRAMNSAVAALTASGSEALRKCWPPSTTCSSALGLLTNRGISSSAFATE